MDCQPAVLVPNPLHIGPGSTAAPLLSQALHIWKADAVERQAAEFVEDQSQLAVNILDSIANRSINSAFDSAPGTSYEVGNYSDSRNFDSLEGKNATSSWYRHHAGGLTGGIENNYHRHSIANQQVGPLAGLIST